MRVATLFRNGELLDRADRVALAILKKLGFPPDYLEFILRYGAGEFSNPVLSLDAPAPLIKEFMEPNLSFACKEPVQIGSFQGGQIMAVNHVGKVLLEYWPRDETESHPVFVTLESMTTSLASKSKVKKEPVFYCQNSLPMCFLTNREHPDRPPAMNDAVVTELLVLLRMDELFIEAVENTLRLHNETLGVSLLFNGDQKIILQFRYEAKLKAIVAVLEKHGWKLDRDPMNLDLLLLEEEL